MQNVKSNETLEVTSAFLDSDFTNIDLNSDIKEMYEKIGSNRLKDQFDDKVKLANLRNENYQKYINLNVSKYKNFDGVFKDEALAIIDLYNYITVKKILNDDYNDSIKNKDILDNIYLRIKKLDNMINTYVKEIVAENDEKQNKFSIVYFKKLDIDEKTKKELINKYNDLILISSSIPKDMYEEVSIQEKRKNGIDEILKIINVPNEKNSNLFVKDRLKVLNVAINLEIQKYTDKFNYLGDLIPLNSKYLDEFNSFKDFFNKLIAYDDKNYENAKQVFEILEDDTKIQNRIDSFEILFIDERESLKKETRFIYEKVGIKNLKNSLNYITANYTDKLSEDNKRIIEYIYDKINSENYDIDELNKALKLVVRGIWKDQITDIYSFNPKKDYYFICSNNQFIDEKYQTILLTKKEIERVDNYEDYQIGFICSYNDNILYITENEDIMTVKEDDMSDLKTPLQLEQEFINFKVCNRIALDGYKTKIQAVYLINDGNIDKYMKASELANMYKLPLIELKKEY